MLAQPFPPPTPHMQGSDLAYRSRRLATPGTKQLGGALGCRFDTAATAQPTHLLFETQTERTFANMKLVIFLTCFQEAKDWQKLSNIIV